VTGAWESHIQAYFRLSGLYQVLFAGQLPDLCEAADHYCAAFRAETNTITHLAPLEFVNFTRSSIEWDEFQIRQFSTDELDHILQNSVKRLFYTWAYLDPAELQDYWFLCAKEVIHADEPGTVMWRMESRVRFAYSRYPSPIQTALQYLALFDWGTNPFRAAPRTNLPRRYEHWDGPFHPQVPFVISISDSLTQWPTRAPDTSVLVKEPFFDSVTGEELGQAPTRGLDFTEEDTERLCAFLNSIAALLKRVQPYRRHWRFVETALGFLVKGFTSEGLEQLLWHITAIEAALGERVEAGLVRLLLTRVSNILGATQDERRRFRKRFEELYKFRSALVHGNVDLADREVYLGHLSEARDFARCVVLWMLHFLDSVAKVLPEDATDVPDRSTLLTLLEWDQDDWRRLTPALRGLPTSFPNVPDWL
jgi:hypothetical protein